MINANEITVSDHPDFKPCMKKPIEVLCLQMKGPFYVDTMEGRMTGNSGDYLMVGIDGEKYPIARDIFERTYDVIGPEK